MSSRLSATINQQKGFTLIDMILVIGIAGLISCAATGAIFQLLVINNQSTAHMTVVKQVENAIHWISRDIQMAQVINLDPDTGFLALSWFEWGDPENPVEVTYTLENGDLRRHSIDAQTLVARYIESASVERDGDKLDFKITAALDGMKPASETRVVEIIPRPSL